MISVLSSAEKVFQHKARGGRQSHGRVCRSILGRASRIKPALYSMSATPGTYSHLHTAFSLMPISECRAECPKEEAREHHRGRQSQNPCHS